MLGAGFSRIVTLGAALLLILPVRSAHAQIGNRDFFSPIITLDPDPGNSLDLSPEAYKGANNAFFSLTFDLEKEIVNNLVSIQLASGWNHPTCYEVGCTAADASRRHHRSREPKKTKKKKIDDIELPPPIGNGWNNLDLFLKWAPTQLISTEHEARLAFGLSVNTSVGTPKAGADTHSYLGPTLMLAKGMGDLPDRGWIRYLRPFALQADAGTLTKTGGSAANFAFSDWAISYSLEYLDKHVHGAELAEWTWTGALTPFVEFTYSGVFATHDGGAPPYLTVLPGLGVIYGPYQVNVGTELALNDATVPYDHATFVALFDITLDELDPRLGWTPF